MNGSLDTPRDYLKRPYARVLTPDEEYGGYTAEILEFPGCVTEGDTADEALGNLEDAAEAWIEAALNMGQDIPEPSDAQGYGGRIALRLPRSLHGRAMRMAEREGTSLNQFLVAAIAERVGAGNLYETMVQDLDRRLDQLAANTTTARPSGTMHIPGALGNSMVLVVDKAVSSAGAQSWFSPKGFGFLRQSEGLSGAMNA
jgi:predicted RNase H-like HicB family nuclease